MVGFIQSRLPVNVAKIKELVVNIWRKRTTTTLLNIMGQDVELLDTYKYLG